MAKLKRIQKKLQINLSEHTLAINTRKCSFDKFRFSEIEDFVLALTNGREYQFEAIKNVMIYLWGGGYNNIEDLAKENWKNKEQIRDRFGSEELFYGHFPLRDRLSGVVHMATGTGKSFVIFAVAYLSVVLGLTKRVLVLGPSSTIIEQGLREKFVSLMNDAKLKSLLPKEYQNKVISLLTDNDAIEDDSIVIENINATYTFGGIQDTLFKNTGEVLVLSDEVHHAYSHLKFNDNSHALQLDVEPGSQKSDENAERLWMKFLRENTQIKRHIGFTGTPYNENDYFADVIIDYSIRTAIDQKFIKEINPLLRTQDGEGEAVEWTDDKRFEVVLKNHLDNKEKYSYRRDGVIQVKPITIFICSKQATAKTATEKFIRFLRNWEKDHNGATGSDSEIEQSVRNKVICVVSSISESEYKKELDHIEEIDPAKIGGNVEFIFAVNKLSEGWDVDNVFQIVPMEERVFNSKLLISQVLGRGLRIPRKVTYTDILQNYPRVTITNHEKFAKHIEELMDAVIQSDMHIVSEPLPHVKHDYIADINDRSKHHFTLLNLNYLSAAKIEDIPEDQTTIQQNRTLKLTTQDLSDPVIIEFAKERKEFIFKKKTVSIDRVIDDLYRRFKVREWEGIKFDFGFGVQDRCPTENEIRTVISVAITLTGITGNQISEENKKQIDLYFNQFLPSGKQKRVFENILGDIYPIKSSSIERSSVRLGELESGDRTVFLSEEYENELDSKTKLVIDHLVSSRNMTGSNTNQQSIFNSDPQDFLGKHKEYVRSLVDGDIRPPFIINTSVLKSPQSAVIVSHTPEKEFVFELLKHSGSIESWIKSPDKGFYSLEYEYWKGGKARVKRNFNPDFFILQKLSKQINIARNNNDINKVDELRKLEEEGVEYIVRVVEIKSDEDQDETINAKSEAGKSHFEALNKKIHGSNPANFDVSVRPSLRHHYIFDLIRPSEYHEWFKRNF